MGADTSTASIFGPPFYFHPPSFARASLVFGLWGSDAVCPNSLPGMQLVVSRPRPRVPSSRPCVPYPRIFSPPRAAGCYAIAMLYPIGSDVAPCRAGWGGRCRHLLPWNGFALALARVYWRRHRRRLCGFCGGGGRGFVFFFSFSSSSSYGAESCTECPDFRVDMATGRVCFGSSRCGVVGRAVFASSCDCVFSPSLCGRGARSAISELIYTGILFGVRVQLSVLRWTLCATLLQLTVDMEWS
jgi:hypothetical protein